MRKFLPVSAIIVIILSAGLLISTSVSAANDRPLIFGMNPIQMDWWGKDPLVWDPVEFQRMALAGCSSARIGVNWDQIEPVQGQRDWSSIDRWVTYCLNNNIEPVVLINSTPAWALPDDIDPNVPVPQARYPAGENHVDDFNNWCYDLALRFRGRVRYYEFWNEANGYGWYTPWDPDPSKQFSRADLYTPWMIRAYKALKLADPGCMMSTTGIDDSGTGHAAYFLGLIYTYGGKGYFDAVADHPYPNGGGFESWKLDQIRDTLDAHGDTNLKVWITEFGYAMDPTQYPTYQQYMTDYFNTLTQDQYSYTTIATWHTAVDFPGESGYGLMKKDLSTKPPYTTFMNYPKPSRPVVSSIVVSNLSASSVRISYNTDVSARGLVMYGTDTTYGNITARETVGSTSHQHTLIGLSPATTYHFRIRTQKADVEDGDAFSADSTFTTAAGPVVHITAGPTVTGITETTATVTWTTDVSSDSTVDYGTTIGYGSTAGSSTLVTAHSVQLNGLEAGTNYQYRVVSSATGHASAASEGHPFTTGTPGFSGLVNGGFENGISGWTFWEVYPWGNDSNKDGVVDYPGHISVTSNGGVFTPSPPSMEGDWRLGQDVGWASAVGGVYQTITAPNGNYLVSGWVAMGGDGGDERVQLIATDGAYGGGIPEGTLIADLTSSSSWGYYSKLIQVTSGALTVSTRVSQWAAVNLVAGHFDGISVRPCAVSGISGMKSGLEGEAVASDSDKIVTAVLNDYTFYAEEENRSSGIKVRTVSPHGLSVSDRVSFAGTLRVQEGEAVVDDATASFSSSGTAIAPLGMANRSIGGSVDGVQPATLSGAGLNTTGLLVRTCGAVKGSGTGYMLVSDGSGSDVRCLLPSGVSADPSWHYVLVTGISTSYLDGSYVLPAITIRSSSDITPLN